MTSTEYNMIVASRERRLQTMVAHVTDRQTDRQVTLAQQCRTV